MSAPKLIPVSSVQTHIVVFNNSANLLKMSDGFSLLLLKDSIVVTSITYEPVAAVESAVDDIASAATPFFSKKISVLLAIIAAVVILYVVLSKKKKI